MDSKVNYIVYALKWVGVIGTAADLLLALYLIFAISVMGGVIAKIRPMVIPYLLLYLLLWIICFHAIYNNEQYAVVIGVLYLINYFANNAMSMTHTIITIKTQS